ncbi:MAG: hypothetical protein KGI54_18850, partial [Pseudomonadota bacterium]|nr:hypothetical protein [Pseudomonadota bacterium]
FCQLTCLEILIMKATPANRPLSLVAQAAVSASRVTNHQTRPSRGVVYEVEPFSAFECGMFAACVAIEAAAFETDSKTAQLSTLLQAEYGEAGPTFEQYRKLQEALKLQSLDAGFTGQAMRKHCAKAVKGLYGALPESTDAAAIAKRAQRVKNAAKARAEKRSSDAGGDTLAGNVSPEARRNPGPQETIEQFIARVGVTATLNALAKILETDSQTKLDAIAIRAMVAHVAKAA